MSETTPPRPAGPRSAAASRVALAQVMGHADTNLYGSVHGGVVMKMIDDAAAAAAGRHAGSPALTVSVQSMSFLSPAHTGDLLTARAQLVEVGRTSMRIQVVVTAERWNDLGPVARVAAAELVFVAVDPRGRPTPVPALVTVEDGWLLGDSTDGTSQLPFVPDETGQRPRHRQPGAGASAPGADPLARLP